jgi:DNA-binding response OmpR family regulator
MTSVITLGNLTIDRERFDVWIAERRIELTFVEFELLYQLARHTERVMQRSRLVQAVWNESASGEDQKLTVHMSRLRKKLRGSHPWRIETVTKRGYVLTESSDDVSGRDDAPALEQRVPRVGGLAR